MTHDIRYNFQAKTFGLKSRDYLLLVVESKLFIRSIEKEMFY